MAVDPSAHEQSEESWQAAATQRAPLGHFWDQLLTLSLSHYQMVRFPCWTWWDSWTSQSERFLIKPGENQCSLWLSVYPLNIHVHAFVRAPAFFPYIPSLKWNFEPFDLIRPEATSERTGDMIMDVGPVSNIHVGAATSMPAAAKPK